jgi:hypothetical protein
MVSPFTLDLWSSEEMCRIMNGRGLVMVGDSIQGEYFYALLSSLTSRILIPHEFQNNEHFIHELRKEVNLICEKFCSVGTHSCEPSITIPCGSYPSFQIHFFRDNHLTPNKPEYQWMDLLGNLNASVLLLNTGAHHKDTNDKLINDLRATFQILSLKYPKLSIIYRNTPTGHHACNETFHSPPFQNQSQVFPFDDKEIKDYHWNEFQKQNEMMQTLIDEEFPNILYLNFYNSSILRADSHPLLGDCLHFCSSSVIDEWVVFLYNSLKYIATVEEIDSPQHHQQEQQQDQRIASNLLPRKSHVLELTFENKFTDRAHSIPTLTQATISERYYLVENGSRFLIPDELTYEVYQHEKRVRTLMIDRWQFLEIPVGKPLDRLLPRWKKKSLMFNVTEG